MKKISSIIRSQLPADGFPVKGQDGYGGEQDGSHVVLSGPLRFASKAAADRAFPEGVPEYIELHWARHIPQEGWEVTFGWWSNDPDEGDENPLIGY